MDVRLPSYLSYLLMATRDAEAKPSLEHGVNARQEPRLSGSEKPVFEGRGFRSPMATQAPPPEVIRDGV
jgi:hypothetical protein